MSTMIHRSTADTIMNAIVGQPHPYLTLSPKSAAEASSMNARLRIIHDLIRSGDYHVPATAIADRMIEQMIIERQERS